MPVEKLYWQNNRKKIHTGTVKGTSEFQATNIPANHIRLYYLDFYTQTKNSFGWLAFLSGEEINFSEYQFILKGLIV